MQGVALLLLLALIGGCGLAHRLPWKQLFEPVINITRDGFSLTEHSGELC